MPRKFGNEIRLPGTTDIDNFPIPLKALCHYITSQIPKNNHRKSW